MVEAALSGAAQILARGLRRALACQAGHTHIQEISDERTPIE
jgi:hypothetical protein